MIFELSLWCVFVLEVNIQFFFLYVFVSQK